MIRTLLATTAIATLLTTGVIAQDTTTPADPNAAPATEAPATDPAAPAADPMAPAPADTTATDTAVEAPTSILATGYTVTDKDNLATEIIGRQVYSSEADDAEHIGDVNDLIIGENGEVAAVVIGVGGFLGIGEKNVAVKYSELQWVVAEDNSERYILPTTKEALEQAPDFRAEDQTPPPDAAPVDNMAAPVDNNAAPMDNNMAAPADNAMAPADPNAVPADNAMAPVDANAAPAGTMTIDPTGFTDVQLTADELEGTTAYGPNNEHLGDISDVVLADDGTTVDAVIIDFGGFLGIGTKPVAVAFDTLTFQRDQNNDRYVRLNVTREQLDQAPAFDANTYKTSRDQQRLVTQG